MDLHGKRRRSYKKSVFIKAQEPSHCLDLELKFRPGKQSSIILFWHWKPPATFKHNCVSSLQVSVPSWHSFISVNFLLQKKMVKVNEKSYSSTTQSHISFVFPYPRTFLFSHYNDNRPHKCPECPIYSNIYMSLGYWNKLEYVYHKLHCSVHIHLYLRSYLSSHLLRIQWHSYKIVYINICDDNLNIETKKRV